MIIYCIENLITHKRYVGYSTKYNSEEELQKSKMWGHGGYINADIVKNEGIVNFKRWVLLKNIFNFKQLKQYEILWIAKLHSHISENGYNKTKGGDGSKGYKHSEIQRIKQSKNMIGLKHSEVWNKNVSLGVNKNWEKRRHEGKDTWKLTEKQKINHRHPKSEKHRLNIKNRIIKIICVECNIEFESHGNTTLRCNLCKMKIKMERKNEKS